MRRKKMFWNNEFLEELSRISGVHTYTLKRLVVLLACELGLIDKISYSGSKFRGHKNSYNSRYYYLRKRGLIKNEG